MLGLLVSSLRRLVPKEAKVRLRGYGNAWAAARRTRRRERAIERYGQFEAGELASLLRETAGIPVGSVLFAQCSLNDMHTFKGGAAGVLRALTEVVGPSGTLLMPAYTENAWATPPRLFDVKKEPTYAGLVSELFRRSPGVIRSLHPRHSICGKGPIAEEILAGHDRCVRADGRDSPFDRLRNRDDAFVVTIGLPFGIASFFHWVEDYEPDKLPFPVHKKMPTKCIVRDAQGAEREVLDWGLRPEVAATVSSGRVARLLSPQALRVVTHKGITICIYRFAVLAKELLDLRDRGIIHYRRR